MHTQTSSETKLSGINSRICCWRRFSRHPTPRTYCWWTKSCTTKDDNYPIIYRILTIPGGAGFLPSTVGNPLKKKVDRSTPTDPTLIFPFPSQHKPNGQKKTILGRRRKKGSHDGSKMCHSRILLLNVLPCYFLVGWRLQSRVDENCMSSKLWEAPWSHPGHPTKTGQPWLPSPANAQVISKHLNWKLGRIRACDKTRMVKCTFP